MTYSNFYLIKNNTLEKKIINPLLYAKYIVRNKNEGQAYDIDFYYKIKIKNFKKMISKKAIIGSSIYLKEYNKIKQTWKDIKLNIFLKNFNKYNLKITKTLNLFFKFIRKQKTQKQYTIVLNPLKSGFLGYFAGVKGFIPGSHYRKVIKNKILLFKTNKYCFFRILLFIEIKIKVAFFYKYNAFKKKKKKRSNIYRNRLNFIFLYEKKKRK